MDQRGGKSASIQQASKEEASVVLHFDSVHHRHHDLHHGTAGAADADAAEKRALRK